MKKVFRFAGSSANIIGKDGRLVYNKKYENDFIICEQFDTANILDFQEDILPLIEESTHQEFFEDGRYHIYFTGTNLWGGGLESESGIWEGWSQFEIDYITWELIEN